MKTNTTLRSALAVAGLVMATQAAAQITFYERENFAGRSFTADRPVSNFERFGFNDRAASAVVESGSWEVCEDARFSGRCVVLRPGQYDSLSTMRLNYQVSSVRPAEDSTASYDNTYSVAQTDTYSVAQTDTYYDRREGERLYDAPIRSVHAVMGQDEERCWVDRERVTSDDRSGPNVGGAVVGAVIGGILGHQIGSGRGNDVATAGGAVAGAALGSNVGRDRAGGGSYTQDVRRCQTVPNERPDYWDVTYTFRGSEHHVQMSSPPVGTTITVNGNGDPRM